MSAFPPEDYRPGFAFAAILAATPLLWGLIVIGWWWLR